MCLTLLPKLIQQMHITYTYRRKNTSLSLPLLQSLSLTLSPLLSLSLPSLSPSISPRLLSLPCVSRPSASVYNDRLVWPCSHALSVGHKYSPGHSSALRCKHLRQGLPHTRTHAIK